MNRWIFKFPLHLLLVLSELKNITDFSAFSWFTKENQSCGIFYYNYRSHPLKKWVVSKCPYSKAPVHCPLNFATIWHEWVHGICLKKFEFIAIIIERFTQLEFLIGNLDMAKWYLGMTIKGTTVPWHLPCLGYQASMSFIYRTSAFTPDGDLISGIATPSMGM